MGNEVQFRFLGIPAQECLAEILHHLIFSLDPVSQGTSRSATLDEPELVRPPLDVSLCLKMLTRSQDNGGGKMCVNQLDGVFAPLPRLRFGLAVKSPWTGSFPARPPLDRVKLRFHGRTSSTEFREP